MTREWWESHVFELGYLANGGSGLGWLPDVVGELFVHEAERFVEMLSERREWENDKIKEASSKK